MRLTRRAFTSRTSRFPASAAGALLVLGGLLFGGCSAGPGAIATPSAGGTVGASAGAPSGPLTGVLLAQGDVTSWVLAEEGLFEVAGGRLAPVAIPRPSSWTSEAIAVDGATVTVALAPDPNSLLLLRSPDGGASWTTGEPVSVASPTGLGDVRVAAIGQRIVVLGNEASGSQLSIALAASSDDAGKGWTVERAPSGGDVAAAGDRFWLVGGAMGDELFASASGSTWERLAIPVKDQFWTAARPVGLKTGEVVVAVTAHSADETEATLTFWATSDGGRSWRPLGSIETPDPGFQLTVPAAIAADGRWLALWPDGSKVVSGRLGSAEQPTLVSPNGLPGAPLAAAFTPDGGAIAVVASSSCPSGKASCTSTTSLVFSADAGQTWAPLR